MKQPRPSHITASQEVWTLYCDLLTAEKYNQAYRWFLSITEEIQNLSKDQRPSRTTHNITAQLTSGNTSLYLRQYKNTGIDTSMCVTIHGPRS